ncbi:hypothetical protein F383_29614 [Gossypium arboreum]|uniref:Uncharacterized protein n=1 Tax=Gossypium arboreum TaxID=29729 RepID=A0A0B0PDL2_GOSAR|nr:hypothetical protein F383_29614 [Gossypium arboreum]
MTYLIGTIIKSFLGFPVEHLEYEWIHRRLHISAIYAARSLNST